MKKYTVYEIEKISEGKLSKYKIRQAIDNGVLPAEYIDQDKKGRGKPKYMVREPDIIKFINDSDIVGFTIKSLEDLQQSRSTFKQKAMTALNTQESFHTIQKLKERIKFLENENSKLVPLLQDEKGRVETEMKKSELRRELILELANNHVFSIKKRNEILKKLNHLA